MKKKDLYKFREKSGSELKKVLRDKKLELLRVSINIKASKEKNLKKAYNLKRDIAQLKTIKKEKELIDKEKKAKGKVTKKK
jgi:ribosomal protein L29